jgi:hypothetical protein
MSTPLVTAARHLADIAPEALYAYRDALSVA